MLICKTFLAATVKNIGRSEQVTSQPVFPPTNGYAMIICYIKVEKNITINLLVVFYISPKPGIYSRVLRREVNSAFKVFQP